MSYIVITASDSKVNIDILAYDSHTGHCDTVVPTCSCPEVTHPAPLFPHTSSPSTTLTSGCKQERTCGSMEHVEEVGVGVGLAIFFPLLFFYIHEALIMTISKSICSVVVPRKHCLYRLPKI